MNPTTHLFKENARAALSNAALQRALAPFELGQSGLADRRRQAVGKLPEFEELRDQATAIKDHTLANLDWYLERFEENCVAAGGHVHWCRTAAEARQTVLDICRSVGARTVTKGKSMIGEEIAINDFLVEHGIEPIETDLGEYIIQIRNEPPSHPITPAIHLTLDQIAGSFRAAHKHLDADRPLIEHRSLLDEARGVLRQKFLSAEVGITGANFLIAETGSSVIVTNEGNGDLTQLLPKAHVVIASLEKVVPTLEDAAVLLRILARSALGQDMSAYTTFSTGPRRPADLDGPEEYHVILLDNGRSALLGSELQEVLRCIRCGACMNHCPVYGSVGGHAYGWVYPGPIGAVLTPALLGIEAARDLPNASTFCGRCESVCPVKIPLPKLMRHHREQEFTRKLSPNAGRYGLAIWAFIAKRPSLYHLLTRLLARALGQLGRRTGSFFGMPLASGWTNTREFPAPQGRTFQAMWRKRRAAPPAELGV